MLSRYPECSATKVCKYCSFRQSIAMAAISCLAAWFCTSLCSLHMHIPTRTPMTCFRGVGYRWESRSSHTLRGFPLPCACCWSDIPGLLGCRQCLLARGCPCGHPNMAHFPMPSDREAEGTCESMQDVLDKDRESSFEACIICCVGE